MLDHHVVLAAQEGDAVIVRIGGCHRTVMDVVASDGAGTVG